MEPSDGVNRLAVLGLSRDEIAAKVMAESLQLQAAREHHKQGPTVAAVRAEVRRRLEELHVTGQLKRLTDKIVCKILEDVLVHAPTSASSSTMLKIL